MRDIRSVILIKNIFYGRKNVSEAAVFIQDEDIEGKFDSCSTSGLCKLIIQRWADKLIFSTQTNPKRKHKTRNSLNELITKNMK